MTAISISMAGWVVEHVGGTEYHTYAQGDDRVVVTHSKGAPTAAVSELYAKDDKTVGKLLALLGMQRARALVMSSKALTNQMRIGIRMPLDDEDRTYAEDFWHHLTGRRPGYNDQAIYLRVADVDAILKRHKSGAIKDGSQ